jgi:hypothetical protein
LPPSAESYDRFAAFLEQQGLIKTPPPVETYAVELERWAALGHAERNLRRDAPR